MDEKTTGVEPKPAVAKPGAGAPSKPRSGARTVSLKPGTHTATWGIPSISGDTFATGKVLSMGVDTATEMEPLPDRFGETVGLALYDQKDELTIEIICESGTPEPAIGGELVVDGIEGIVMGVSKKWENKGWKKLSVKATHFNAMDQA